MNKLLTALGVSALILASISPVGAEDTPAREEHYHVEIPATKEASTTLLSEKIGEISTILKANKELDPVTFEEIHEISYSLEAAVDGIKAADGASSELDTLDEAVQALHYASESQEEAKTREWFAKLEPAAGNIKADASAKAEQPEDKDVYEIVIKDHKFSPERLTVPAGKKIKLKVHNQDSTPEEFESHDFNREKIIGGNTTATIFVGPLEPGEYHYFGEFNMDSANGYIIAK